MWFILGSFLRACICSTIKDIWKADFSFNAGPLSATGWGCQGLHTQEAPRSIWALGPNSFTQVFLSGLRPWGQPIPIIALISVSVRHQAKYNPGSLLQHQRIVHHADPPSGMLSRHFHTCSSALKSVVCRHGQRLWPHIIYIWSSAQPLSNGISLAS